MTSAALLEYVKYFSYRGPERRGPLRPNYAGGVRTVLGLSEEFFVSPL
jgi:hypothetical protein